MADKFTEVTTQGYGSRIIGSIVGIFIGIALFAGSFYVFYWNEGRKDMSVLAATAKDISATDVGANKPFDGLLVAAAGQFTTDETLGDGLYLKPGNYIKIEREVEMYAWTEETEEKTRTNTGGSQTTTTTYSYTKEWTSSPESSNGFKHPEGHHNPEKTIDDYEGNVGNAKVGAYMIGMAGVQLPRLSALQLDEENIKLKGNAVLEGNQYIYVDNGGGSLATPAVGDLRISYSVLIPGKNVTIIGRLDGPAISAFVDQKFGKLYRVFEGSKEQAVAVLHTEYVMWKWIFRGIGFLCMWMGLSLVFGPISVVLDILPVAGSISRALIGGVCFLISLVLSGITIFVSMIAHSLVALVVLFAVGILAVVVFGVAMKKKGGAKRAAA